MNCEEATRLVVDDLGGRLDDRGRAILNDHLITCAACRDLAAAQREVSSVLAARPAADVPPSFAPRVVARLRQESGWFGVADWRWLSVRLAPVAALLLLGAGLVIERQSVQTSAPASLSAVFDTWTSGGSESVPVTAVLWRPDAGEDAALLTVLTAPSDATIVRQTDER